MELKNCNRWSLFDAMVNKLMVTHNGSFYYIKAIELEDGSGYNFNVTLNGIKVFVRCCRL